MSKQKKINNEKFVLILGLAGLISAADNWVVSPVLPDIAKSFFIPIPMAGLVLTTYMVPYGIMQPFYGILGDRIGKLIVLQCLIWGLAIGTLACALSPFFWLLCLARAITGFFAAGIIALSLALIGDELPLNESQNYVGKFMGIVFLGQGLSVGLGGFLANYVNWHIIFIIFSLIAILSSVLLKKISSSSYNNINDSGFLSNIKVVFTNPKSKIIFPLAFCSGFLLLGLYGYVGSFLNKTMLLSASEAGAIMSVLGFSCLFTGIWLGNITKKVDRKHMLIYGGLFALSMPILLLFFPHWFVACIAIAGLGVGYIFIQSTLASCAFEIATKSKGFPSALIGFGLFGGGGIGSLFGGYILALSNYKMLFMFFANFLIIFIIIVMFIRNRSFYCDEGSMSDTGVLEGVKPYKA